jgi:site-specific recombinase XerD
MARRLDRKTSLPTTRAYRASLARESELHMTTLLAPMPLSGSAQITIVEEAAATHFGERARSDRTRAAYRSDFALFTTWCAARDLAALPADPQTVARYVSSLATRKFAVATIVRHLASISVTHKRAGLESPCGHPALREIMQGVRRDLGVAQTKKAPLVVEDLRRVVAPLGSGRADLRDRAILTLGFAGAFRRSEIVSLDVEDLAFVRNGLEVTLRRSKTDQEARGELVAIPYGSNVATCPVRAVEAWLGASGATSGPLFLAVSRSGRVLDRRRLCARAIALIVKARALAVGINADLSGHSLRAGFATSAANCGISLVDSMRQTRHKSIAVAYVRRATAWDRNAAASVGL